MSRKLFHEPLGDLISHSSPNNLSPDRRMISVNKKLAIISRTIIVKQFVISGVFMDVIRKWPGCVHDAKMLCNSNISETL